MLEMKAGLDSLRMNQIHTRRIGHISAKLGLVKAFYSPATADRTKKRGSE